MHDFISGADPSIMQVNATSADIQADPAVFAGIPVSSWVFAIRVWLAVILALYASFWLELEAPLSSAITVVTLALPTRGQGMEKATFRLIATAIGIAGTIAIVRIFAQTDFLLLAAFAVWIGLCVCASGMLDGNRAYAESSSGRARSVAAGNAMVELVMELFLVRALTAVATQAARRRTFPVRGVNPAAIVLTSVASDSYHRSFGLTAMRLVWLRRELLRKNRARPNRLRSRFSR
jgi:hypothetical protein